MAELHQDKLETDENEKDYSADSYFVSFVWGVGQCSENNKI
jgi:hypothetical protein